MPQPLVIGHACAAGEAPANTLAGVRACLDAGAGAMEIDVRLAADGVPVLMHDETVDRTTELSGLVRSFTSARLAAADAGGGERVPALADVLTCVDGRLMVMCELKSTAGDAREDERLVDAVVAVIGAHPGAGGGAFAWTAVHSFSPAIVAHSREREPRLSAAIISPTVSGEDAERLFAAAIKRGAQAVSVEHSAVNREFILAAKRRQLTVWAWTADDPADWTRLRDAGVDGIITNLPHALRRFFS